MDAAFDARSLASPEPLLDRIFDNLPDVAKFVILHKTRIYCAALMTYALRLFAENRVQLGNAQLLRAVVAASYDFNTREVFRDQLIAMAAAIPDQSPIDYVKNVFNYLPTELWAWRGMCRSIVADVSLTEAFDAYARKDDQMLRLALATAARHRPTIVFNRGTWSILVRSFIR